MKRNWTTILFIIVVLCISSCDVLGNDSKGFHFDETTFSSEWNNWDEQQINNYSFVLKGSLPDSEFERAILMKKYEVKVVVKNGAMVSFDYTETPPYSVPNSEPEFTSISDMYQKIYDSAQGQKQWWEEYSGDGGFVSTEYKIHYDRELHYITSFEPVTSVKSGWILDTAEHKVTVSDFTILDEI